MNVPRRQRGVALLMAMIIVTLVATLASAMIWQQWRAVQVEAAERARAQSAWILSGALDWARLILREDAKTAGADHLGEPWSVPLAEARLSTFLAADKSNTDDAPEAFLSGSITDAQSRYNLRNLIDAQGKVDANELAALQQLLQSIGVAPDVADRVATGMHDALAPPGSAGSTNNVPLLPQRIGQLGFFGIDADSIQRMTPYVVLLPIATPVNLNTAPRDVIAAVIPGLGTGGAERLVQVRQRTPFKAIADAQPYVPSGTTLTPRVSTASSFFEVHGRLRLTDRVLEETSLIERRGLSMVPLWRQRESSRDSS